MKPTKCPATDKNDTRKAKEAEKRGEEHAYTRTSQAKIFCIWIRRPPGPVNVFVVNSCSLQHDSDQKTARLALKSVFRQHFRGRMG